MAIMTTLICDLNGTAEAVSTHTVTINGVTYEIDMSEEAFAQTLGKIVSKGRPVTKSGISGKSPTGDRLYSTKDVRKFAQQAGYSIGSRGRFPHTILLDYIKEGEPTFEDTTGTQMRPYPMAVLNAHKNGTTVKSKTSVVKGNFQPSESSLVEESITLALKSAPALAVA